MKHPYHFLYHQPLKQIVSRKTAIIVYKVNSLLLELEPQDVGLGIG